jgi:hypothetical protein
MLDDREADTELRLAVAARLVAAAIPDAAVVLILLVPKAIGVSRTNLA